VGLVKEIFYVSIDFGGSSTKVVVSFQGKVTVYAIGPEVIQVFRQLSPEPGDYNLVKHLWVSTGEGETYAVGELARREHCATIPLVAAKSNYVVVRTMAAVAIAAKHFQLKAFDINIRCLLPAAEYDLDLKLELKAALTRTLSSFTTPIGRIRARVKDFRAVPEGMGLAKHFSAFSQGCFDNSDVACVMLGHRNTSLFLMSGGKPTFFRSNDFGFIRAIEFAKVDQVEALDDLSLVSPNAIAEYWIANQNWLSENWPKNTKALVIGGGPLATIKEEAKRFFSERIPMMPGQQVAGIFADGGFPSKKIGQGFAWPDDINLPDSLKSQFADVYCDWQCAQSDLQKLTTNKRT
jgi:hypothetical protein